MDTKERFYSSISTHYHNISDNTLPDMLLEKISEIITNYYYEQYKRFYREHPKSAKRYPSFDLMDLTHPKTHELIINYIKQKYPDSYLIFSSSILNKTIDEVSEIEAWWEGYHKK